MGEGGKLDRMMVGDGAKTDYTWHLFPRFSPWYLSKLPLKWFLLLDKLFLFTIFLIFLIFFVVTQDTCFLGFHQGDIFLFFFAIFLYFCIFDGII